MHIHNKFIFVLNFYLLIDIRKLIMSIIMSINKYINWYILIKKLQERYD